MGGRPAGHLSRLGVATNKHHHFACTAVGLHVGKRRGLDQLNNGNLKESLNERSRASAPSGALPAPRRRGPHIAHSAQCSGRVRRGRATALLGAAAPWSMEPLAGPSSSVRGAVDRAIFAWMSENMLVHGHQHRIASQALPFCAALRAGGRDGCVRPAPRQAPTQAMQRASTITLPGAGANTSDKDATRAHNNVE